MATVHRRGSADLRPFGFVAPALAWTVAFFCVPFVVMAIVSLWERVGTDLVASWSFANYAKFFARGHFFEAMVNSLEVTFLVTVLSVLLAYPLAWILAEKVPPRWQRLALICAILPFWTSYVVRSYAWVLVLASNGVVNQALQATGLIDEPLRLANTRTATVIGFVHFFVMLLTLTIFANLMQLPKNYARAAADLGAGPIRTFWYVILPLTLPGIMVGAFLTFVLCIGDYITPQILGGNSDLVMPQLIMLQIDRRADFPTASALAILLMVVVTVVYIACARWLKLERS
ncbi:ABC transporter permease [Amorphus orientalis]|uniref:Spermidine/putrescine transport system permease protein n=1 Tax=Amorphus orientalis TaxID=649198 RepID=A0AAE3VLY7_9HYPH|nr:ABC transporter permease [Amorphus orientalis]MDQ0314121.1 spermidine/putrescine transport system permease protein [Amorphus orientalis]